VSAEAIQKTHGQKLESLSDAAMFPKG